MAWGISSLPSVTILDCFLCSFLRLSEIEFGGGYLRKSQKTVDLWYFQREKKHLRKFLLEIAVSRKAADISCLFTLSIGTAVSTCLRQLFLNTSCVGLLFFCKFR